ncbi:unnamed protein product [marine sediment metagenome]|uniref:Uncharacterized protein n=1 Tax=marine sediment metagenome TaxID=412755 RepID=X0WPR5_9ZZZZ
MLVIAKDAMTLFRKRVEAFNLTDWISVTAIMPVLPRRTKITRQSHISIVRLLNIVLGSGREANGRRSDYKVFDNEPGRVAA